MAFSSENLEICLNLREYSRPIPTASYPPFTKGTRRRADLFLVWGVLGAAFGTSPPPPHNPHFQSMG